MDNEYNKRWPNFFIVGAPKCGTSSMYDYLSQHPDIFMSKDNKEPNYFGCDLAFKYQKPDAEKYLSYFSQASKEKKIGEATVWYLYSKNAATEISKICPTAKIIIMLRSPVDMLYSLHSQMIINGDEDILDFEGALDAENERSMGMRIPRTAMFPSGLLYRQIMKFSEQVQRYFDVFGRDNVKVIIFDDLKCEPLKVYIEVLHFLEVDESFRPTFTVVNPNRKIRSMYLHHLLLAPPPRLKMIGKMFFSKSIRSAISNKLYQHNIRYAKRNRMDNALKKQLQAEFASEVEKLSILLNRDLTHWSKS